MTDQRNSPSQHRETDVQTEKERETEINPHANNAGPRDGLHPLACLCFLLSVSFLIHLSDLATVSLNLSPTPSVASGEVSHFRALAALTGVRACHGKRGGGGLW